MGCIHLKQLPSDSRESPPKRPSAQDSAHIALVALFFLPVYLMHSLIRPRFVWDTGLKGLQFHTGFPTPSFTQPPFLFPVSQWKQKEWGLKGSEWLIRETPATHSFLDSSKAIGPGAMCLSTWDTLLQALAAEWFSSLALSAFFCIYCTNLLWQHWWQGRPLPKLLVRASEIYSIFELSWHSHMQTGCMSGGLLKFKYSIGQGLQENQSIGTPW